MSFIFPTIVDLLLCREHQIAGITGHPMRIFARPFDIAADGIGQRYTNRFAVGDFIEYAVEVIDSDSRHITRAVDATTAVHEFSARIEDVKMWRAQRAIGTSDVLGFIV